MTTLSDQLPAAYSSDDLDRTRTNPLTYQEQEQQQREDLHRMRLERRAYDLAKLDYSGHMYNNDSIRAHYIKMALVEEADGRLPRSDDPRLNAPLPDWLEERAFTISNPNNEGRDQVQYRPGW